ncbi:MAG: DUF4233 domain-containing protein [Frankiaceae bacterium]
MTAAPPAGRPRDPARGLRGIGAAILITHAIVVGLSVPIVTHRSGGAPAVAVAGLIVIAVADLVVAGLLRRAERAAVVAGSVLQAATLAAGALSGFLLFLAVLFSGLWIGWLSMRRSYAAAMAAHARAGAVDAGERR